MDSLIRSLLNNEVAPIVIRQNKVTPRIALTGFIMLQLNQMTIWRIIPEYAAALELAIAVSIIIYAISIVTIPRVHFTTKIITASYVCIREP